MPQHDLSTIHRDARGAIGREIDKAGRDDEREKKNNETN
jgi:hypothetical protein